MIVSLEEFTSIRPQLKNVVATSGGFDPIHPGHIACIRESKQYGDVLVVIVNGDNFLSAKKGKPFMDLATRAQIVDSIKDVDYTIPYEVANDMTVRGVLPTVRPDVFTKGGDRFDEKTIPEWDICRLVGIRVIGGVGGSKSHSSSEFLNKWHG